MVVLSDLSFAIYDASSGKVETVDPAVEKRIPQGTIERGFAEKATELLYRHHFDWRVEKINQRRRSNRLSYALGIGDNNRSRSWDMPEGLGDYVLQLLRKNTDAESDDEALSIASVDGIPDFLVCNRSNIQEFQFVEAKREDELLQQTQSDWFTRFDFFTIKIMYVFDRPTDRDSFVENHSLSDLYQSAARQPTVEDIDDRQELSPSEIAQRVTEMEVGDWVVFNERKKPLEVGGVDVPREVRGSEERGVELISPKGNRYLLSDSGEFFVEKDNRRKLKWVRKVSKD